jgi:hypothetical protein
MLVLVCTMATALVLAQQRYDANAPRYVISGRVVDPHRLRPEGAVLTLGEREDESYSRRQIALHGDGSLVTPPVSPGLHVLEIRKTPESRRNPARLIGFAIVQVESSDVSGVTVEVRRDTAITGMFRMETDNPKAAWPAQIVDSIRPASLAS